LAADHTAISRRFRGRCSNYFDRFALGQRLGLAPVLPSVTPQTRILTRETPKTMRRSNRPGFTFIELLTVLVVMGALASIGVPRIRNMKERSYQATLRSDLGALRTAEEAYFAENLRYTTDLTALEFRRSTNVTITIESSDPLKGWRAAARHLWLATPCTTATGPDAVGVESGAVVCSNVALPSGGAQGGD
jgi:prepilin-type N-terminal cleavage/methylation domain-containing protein